ncbi:MAG: tRNA (adenosine(37)-N6)-threonylcarbamoyltransferase complex ATPase subunit type 1 TsaE [Vulcanimicrobiaceae bacterium]
MRLPATYCAGTLERASSYSGRLFPNRNALVVGCTCGIVHLHERHRTGGRTRRRVRHGLGGRGLFAKREEAGVQTIVRGLGCLAQPLQIGLGSRSDLLDRVAWVRGQDRSPLFEKMATDAVSREFLFAKRMERTFHTEAQLNAFAADFARSLRPGDVIGLSGPLGAGKTVFVRAIVRALHGEETTSSPTFTFWHRYIAPANGRTVSASPIDHLDLYRVDDPADLVELGLDEVFDSSSIVLVEWWKNAPALLPRRHYEIEITGRGNEARHVSISSNA